MDSAGPRFSIVTAVHDVEPYLPDFIASIEAQRFDAARIEVIAVDDGSTDRSLELLRTWQRSAGPAVTVLTKPNGGQGSARNLGLEHATGEWVTFTDPDDILDPDFFTVADEFLAAHPGIEVASSKPLLFDEASGEIRDTHPRGRQYARGNRVVDLDAEPNVFTGSASVSLFRLDRIREAGLRYDTRVRPNFEDGHFAVRYLMGLPRPVVGILAGAKYIYRKRAAGDSTLQRAASDPGRYTDVFEYGYLDVLHSARSRYGSIPAWLQHVVIYELTWYLSEDEKISSPIRIAPDVVPRFHELFAQVRECLDPAIVRAHTVRRMRPVWADILAENRPGRTWHSRVAARTKVDAEMGLQRINYRFVGAAPREEFLLDGRPVEPAFAKTMAHVYYRRSLLSERVVWVPLGGGLRLRLDDRNVRIADDWPPTRSARPRSIVQRAMLYGSLTQDYVVKAASRRLRRAGRWLFRSVLMAPVRLLAAAPAFRSRFANAWVVMDRLHDADDNGQRLFEYLRAERPDINAWFVIEKGTPDDRRIRATGETHVVDYGSFAWRMLMLNARWLLSSHADVPIVRNPAIMRLVPRPTWKFAFLQHGVIKDDLSLWLNAKDIDLFVVSTAAELESVAGDGTTYIYTSKEVRNTGLPRFDRLLEKGRAVPPEERDLVIVAPTWRNWLNLPLAPASQRRAVDEAFWGSEYFASWDSLLRSAALAAAVADRGWRLAFMPHPNMQSILSTMDLPPNVEPIRFTGRDVQDVYAHCALLITDYSSVAFNTAYIDRPVVYFQFDRERMMSGEHVGRQGYFDYDRDGFGPVATTVDGAVAAAVSAVEHGPTPTPEYEARIAATFAARDGGACRRVVAAVEDLSRRYVAAAERVTSPGTAEVDLIRPSQPG